MDEYYYNFTLYQYNYSSYEYALFASNGIHKFSSSFNSIKWEVLDDSFDYQMVLDYNGNGTQFLYADECMTTSMYLSESVSIKTY